jgi:hypothetical protein
MIIEIVEFPIENGGSFHSYVNVYQRVDVENLPSLDFLKNLPAMLNYQRVPCVDITSHGLEV